MANDQDTGSLFAFGGGGGMPAWDYEKFLRQRGFAPATPELDADPAAQAEAARQAAYARQASPYARRAATADKNVVGKIATGMGNMLADYVTAGPIFRLMDTNAAAVQDPNVVSDSEQPGVPAEQIAAQRGIAQGKALDQLGPRGLDAAGYATSLPGASVTAGPGEAVFTAGRRRRPGGGGAPRTPADETAPLPPRGHNMPPELLPAQAPVAAAPGAAAASTGDVAAQAVAPAKGGRAPAITSVVQLRDKPLDEAIKFANTGQHLIPQPGGGFSGAPRTVQSAADLDAMRASFDEAVRQGASAGGEKWYHLGRQVVQEMAPNNPAEQAQLARLLGLTSSQATPETNLQFALQARNAYQAGTPAEIVRTGAQAQKYNTARATGTDIPLGPKTDIYGINLDPNKPWSTTGTNDIWHARAFGYTDQKGKPWDAALSPQQHSFLDAETVLAVDRANKMKLGGRSDWTAPEIQAAAWVGRKAQAVAGAGNAPDPATLVEAAKGYKESLQKHTAYGTAEATPGVGTGHLPAVAEGSPELRAKFAADPRSSYSKDGYDVYHGATGIYQRPTLPTTGVYEGPKGLEVNPGEAARSMVSFEGESGARLPDKPSQQLMSGAEAAKAYTGAQNAGAWSMTIPTNKPGRATSFQFPTGGQWTPEQVDAIRNIGARYGVGDVVHQGDQAYLTNWGGRPGGAISPKDEATLAAEVSAKTGAGPGQRTEVAGDLIDYSKQWQQPQGSGAVTRELRKQLTPDIIANLDSSPAVRDHVRGLIERDIEYAKQTGSALRPDLQTARNIIVKEGFAGLFKALDSGKVALPAVAGLMALLPELVKQGPQQPSPTEPGT